MIAVKRRQHVRFEALLIEADDAYRAVITACMVLAGCNVHDVATIQLGLDALGRRHYDLIVWGLPFPMPDQRHSWIADVKVRSDSPVVLVAASSENAQRDLEAGADQWLPKPFVPGALVGAVRAALRRTTAAVVPLAADHEIAGMQVSGRERSVSYMGHEESFTRQEWDLLTILIDHPNRFLTAHEVLRLGWRAGVYGPEEVRIYMRRLRRKMEPMNLPCTLVTRRGHGYCLKFAA